MHSRRVSQGSPEGAPPTNSAARRARTRTAARRRCRGLRRPQPHREGAQAAIIGAGHEREAATGETICDHQHDLLLCARVPVQDADAGKPARADADNEWTQPEFGIAGSSIGVVWEVKNIVARSCPVGAAVFDATSGVPLSLNLETRPRRSTATTRRGRPRTGPHPGRTSSRPRTRITPEADAEPHLTRQTGPAPSASRPSTPPTGPASRRRTTRRTPSRVRASRRTTGRSWRTGRPTRAAPVASPSSTAPCAARRRLTAQAFGEALRGAVAEEL